MKEKLLVVSSWFDLPESFFKSYHVIIIFFIVMLFILQSSRFCFVQVSVKLVVADLYDVNLAGKMMTSSPVEPRGRNHPPLVFSLMVLSD